MSEEITVPATQEPAQIAVQPQQVAKQEAPPPVKQSTAIASTTADLMTLGGFEVAQRIAAALTRSTMVPEQYQIAKNPNALSNCLVALNMANRMGADPLMVMQNLVVIHGRPSWSSQFLIATFNACKQFSGIRYEWSGTEGADDWGCRAYTREAATGERLQGTKVTIAMAKKEGWYQKSGSKWQSMPEQMLMFRAAAWMIRTTAPEVSMGLMTQEESYDVPPTRGAMPSFDAINMES